MTRTEQDQLAAAKGPFLPPNPARDEAMRYGYDPMPEFQRRTDLAAFSRAVLVTAQPMIYPGVDS